MQPKYSSHNIPKLMHFSADRRVNQEMVSEADKCELAFAENPGLGFSNQRVIAVVVWM